MEAIRSIPRTTGPRARAAALILVALALGTALTLWPTLAEAATFNHNRASARERVLRSPPGASTSSSNWIYRAFTIPAGSNWLELEYDYLCSGQGITCASDYWTTGPWQTMQSIGTGHNSGHFKYTLPTGYSTIWIRFRYDKGTFTSYQDLMWVDDIRLTSNVMEEQLPFSADEPLSGWIAGGDNGGFILSKLPVARAAGPSEDMGANTTIDLQRSVHFAGTWGNGCVVTYATDTAPTHVFRVYEGSNVLAEESGKSHGTLSLPFSDGSGWKVLKLSFSKDGQPDGGRDFVRVKGITCYTAGSTAVGHYDFDGQALDSSPYSGWSSSCTGNCSGASWRVLRATPHDSYVPVQSFGNEPYTLDGLPKEYHKQGNATRALLFDAFTPSNHEASLDLFATSTSLHSYFRVNAVTPGAVGDESGWFYLYLDQRRAMTLARDSECSTTGYELPAAGDRLVLFSYALSAGIDEYTVQPADYYQYKGNCAGGWVALDGGAGDQPVVIEAHLLDPGNDSIGLEVKVDLWGSIVTEQLLGLGFRHHAYNPSAYREFFPFHDYGADPPLHGEVYGWETVRLTEVPSAGVEPTERPDACCKGLRDFL